MIGVNYVGVWGFIVSVGLGFFLMMEFIGLFGMIEMLLVIINI